jgi:small GTP-binding protein
MMMARNAGSQDAKVVMLGSQSVGKTSIVNRFIRESFGPCTPTVGAVFLSKIVRVGDIEVKVQIWDTSGSERYRLMAPMYYHDAQAAIIVYDVTSAESFRDIESWLAELTEEGPESIVVAIVGNKSDLNDRRVVPLQMAKDFVEQHHIRLQFETSASTGENVAKLFDAVADAVVNATLGMPLNRAQPTDQTGQRGCAC